MRRSTYPAGSAVEKRTIAPPNMMVQREQGAAISDTAKKILPHGLLFRHAVVCNKCAAGYDEGLVDVVTLNEIAGAFWRVNDYCIGRIGPIDGREEACYDCEDPI